MKQFLWIPVVIVSLAFPATAFSKPERIPIKSAEKRSNEIAARKTAGSVQFSQIKDVETRKALQAAFIALGLPAKD